MDSMGENVATRQWQRQQESLPSTLLDINVSDESQAAAMAVDLPSKNVMSQYIRYRIEEMLREEDASGRKKLSQNKLAEKLGLSSSYISRFRSAEQGAGDELVIALRKHWEIGQDKLEADAIAWAKASNIPLDDQPDPFPNRTKAVAMARGELDPRAIDMILTLQPDHEMPFRWWYTRIMMESDLMREQSAAPSFTMQKHSAQTPETTGGKRKR